MGLNAVFKRTCDLLAVNDWFVRLNKRNLLVVNYHGVVAERRPDRWNYENWTHAVSFRRELRWLNKVFQPVDIAGLRRWREGQWTAHKPPVIVTFDDGYRNNLDVAAPILQAEGIPAVFFVSTGYVGTRRTLWPDEVTMRVLNWPAGEITLPFAETAAFAQELASRRRMAYAITEDCKTLPDSRRVAYLQYLRDMTPQPYAGS